MIPRTLRILTMKQLDGIFGAQRTGGYEGFKWMTQRARSARTTSVPGGSSVSDVLSRKGQAAVAARNVYLPLTPDVVREQLASLER